MYNYPTIIEPTNERKDTLELIYRVVAQDNSTGVSLYEGTYDECHDWRKRNCRTVFEPNSYSPSFMSRTDDK
jgi:hypothetical protein